MKKCCMSFVFLALLFVFSACPGVNEDNTSIITKMKALSSKTFSYFTLDEQEDEIRIKEELVFSSFDEENNTISASLFSASWDSENKTQRGEKIEDMSFTPSEFKKLIFSLDNQRQIDNSITLKNKTYECCSQEYKWAKILENKKWQWQEEIQKDRYEFFAINSENNTIEQITHTSNAGGDMQTYSGTLNYDILEKQLIWTINGDTETFKLSKIKPETFRYMYGTNQGFRTFNFVENWT